MWAPGARRGDPTGSPLPRFTIERRTPCPAEIPDGGRRGDHTGSPLRIGAKYPMPSGDRRLPGVREGKAGRPSGGIESENSKFKAIAFCVGAPPLPYAAGAREGSPGQRGRFSTSDPRCPRPSRWKPAPPTMGTLYEQMRRASSAGHRSPHTEALPFLDHRWAEVNDSRAIFSQSDATRPGRECES